MAVGQLAPSFLRAESRVLFPDLGRLARLRILQLLERGAASQRGGCGKKQAVMEGRPHRLGKPDTVVRIPVIMD
jgi:hypothetical protein